MDKQKKLALPAGAAVFHERAAEYDSWFENSLLFDIELSALQELRPLTSPPALEVGIGPGRFAQALKTQYGVDPALSALQLANLRDIIVINGLGDNLPIQTGSMATVWLLFTLCFLEDAAAVLQECHRVLTPNGQIILGFIPAESAWGVALRRKAEQNHPYYSHAKFYTPDEVKTLLRQCGFTVHHSKSTLFQPPKNLQDLEKPQDGIEPTAGFCALLAKKQ